MNPFNSEPLTADQLEKDCLSFLSIQQKPVKSSRLFMGHIHDVNVKRLNTLFEMEKSAYKTVALNEDMIRKLSLGSKGKRVFFQDGVPESYVDSTVGKETFESFEEAYHQLIIDLVDLTEESIKLIIGEKDNTKNIYISGGFSKNPIFLKLMASRFPDKSVFTSEVANATSLGAALVLWKGIDAQYQPSTLIRLTPRSGIKSHQGGPLANRLKNEINGKNRQYTSTSKGSDHRDHQANLQCKTNHYLGRKYFYKG